MIGSFKRQVVAGAALSADVEAPTRAASIVLRIGLPVKAA